MTNDLKPIGSIRLEITPQADLFYKVVAHHPWRLGRNSGTLMVLDKIGERPKRQPNNSASYGF